MNDKLRSLALTLERMNALYQRVMGLLARERQALIDTDYENLYVYLREKDEILSAIRALDKDRLRIQDYFAILFDRDANDLSLNEIAMVLITEGAAAAEGERLLGLREKLLSTVKELRDRVEHNKVFLEKSIENLRGIAENLARTVKVGGSPAPAKTSQLYNQKAKVSTNTPDRTGALVEKRF